MSYGADQMSWLDKPISSRGSMVVSCIILGFAAGDFGMQVGMSYLSAIPIAVMVCFGIMGVADYIAKSKVDE